jgi:hypothetical protein
VEVLAVGVGSKWGVFHWLVLLAVGFSILVNGVMAGGWVMLVDG